MLFLFFMLLFHKIFDRMSNGVDSNQTAQEKSDVSLDFLHMPFCQKR